MASQAPQRAVVPSVGSGILAGATPLSATADDASVRISIILKPQRVAELQARVSGGYFHRGTFLTVPAFANRYGQSPATIKAFLTFLHGQGLKATAYRDRLNIAVTGSAKQINKIFNVKLKNYRVAATSDQPAQTVHGTTQMPTLPTPLAKATLAVFGLTNYHGAYKNHAVAAKVPSRSSQATASGPPPGQLKPSDFLRLYHGKTLQSVAGGGKGQTLGIVTLATAPVADVYSFWKQLNIPVAKNKISVRNIDGGAGKPSYDAGSDETALDMEQSGAIAPAAKVVVYQAPNTDVGFSDAFFTAVSSNAAGSFSTSWGESETFIKAAIATGSEPTTYGKAINVPLLEAGAQGQATFASSGDSGAYDATADLGSTNLSVDVQANSPYTLAAGGTTLSARQYPLSFALPDGSQFTIKIPNERAWGWDYFTPAWKSFNERHGTTYTEKEWALQNIAGDGGGESDLFGMPAYQSAFPGINSYSAVNNYTPTTPTKKFDGFPKLPFSLPSAFAVHLDPAITSGTVQGSHRLVPDVSTDADPETGYGVYTKLYGPVFGTDWVQFGGTSFVSPQLNGVSALLQAQSGGRVGFWNPSIYRFARAAGSPFKPLNAQGTIGGTTVKNTANGLVYTVPGNNNLYWTGKPGTRYNMATGLGIPNLTRLGQEFSH